MDKSTKDTLGEIKGALEEDLKGAQFVKDQADKQSAEYAEKILELQKKISALDNSLK